MALRVLGLMLLRLWLSQAASHGCKTWCLPAAPCTLGLRCQPLHGSLRLVTQPYIKGVFGRSAAAASAAGGSAGGAESGHIQAAQRFTAAELQQLSSLTLLTYLCVPLKHCNEEEQQHFLQGMPSIDLFRGWI
jgi:hypothetical protein